MPLSEQLRRRIDESGMSVLAISRESGVPQSMLARFVDGLDIRLKTAERLAEYFGLELSPKDSASKAKPSRTATTNQTRHKRTPPRKRTAKAVGKAGRKSAK